VNKETVYKYLELGDQILIVVGLATFIMTIVNFFYQVRQKRIDNDEISIHFKERLSKEVRRIDGSILRKDFSRGEVQGIIRANLRDAKTDYNIAALKSVDFFSSISSVSKNRKIKAIEIELSVEELQDFPFEKWQKVPSKA